MTAAEQFCRARGRIRTIGALFVCAILVVGCGATTNSPASPTATTTAVASRCEAVPPVLTDAIASGLTVTGGGTLGRSAAVRSHDYEKVWFVAAAIDGPGFDDASGVWATNDLNGGGMIFAADGTAREFSEWGHGQFSITDDGAEQARDCLSGA